jgi:hypothetical protein
MRKDIALKVLQNSIKLLIINNYFSIQNPLKTDSQNVSQLMYACFKTIAPLCLARELVHLGTLEIHPNAYEALPEFLK